MTYEEALAYLNRHGYNTWNLGLSRIRSLMEALSDPQKKLKYIHVCGSNGKGSTCAMLERILREAGYRTGFFPSPYIEDFRERIQVSGEMIPKEDLVRITARVKDIADAMEDHPTHFELVTAIGLTYFAERQCDIVVLEVGLGGEFDATNVIDAPEVAVVTHIGLEHTEYLGKTLAAIAKTKSGIIKPGCDVVSYENEAEVMEVIKEVCATQGCPLHIASFSRLILHASTLRDHTLSWERPDAETAPDVLLPEEVLLPDGMQLTLSLPGEYQLHNLTTVLTVTETLRARGFHIPEEAVTKALSGVRWSARFEVLSREPLFILDGGHNPQCAEALAESIRLYVPGQKVVFLAGVLKDKDYAGIIGHLAPFAVAFCCVTPDSARALSGLELAAFLRGQGFHAVAYDNIREAIRESLSQGYPVVAFGSLYMAGAIRRAFPDIIRTS